MSSLLRDQARMGEFNNTCASRRASHDSGLLLVHDADCSKIGWY